ncbi:MAG TPA: isoprenoid biosynthesis glyoxalase ElbB [Bacteroidetes bacterium]|nr:isoprenoid biosynthesis glyoxalase ElbB [Bacteroidota bacterium]
MKFAIILSGCGVFDGAEIHESVMTMLAIAKNGGSYDIFAPDVRQHHVINHLKGEEMDEQRNVLVEAARIARGKIKALHEYSPGDYDALIIPGGFGVAKNLCTYAIDGTDFYVDKVVEKALKSTHAAGKAIGALCISPVLLAGVFEGIDVTIGKDKSTAADIEKLGAVHIETGPCEIVVDNASKIVSTPAYMLDSGIEDIYAGADNLVKAIIEMVKG